jgi:hypothetical protein
MAFGVDGCCVKGPFPEDRRLDGLPVVALVGRGWTLSLGDEAGSRLVSREGTKKGQ